MRLRLLAATVAAAVLVLPATASAKWRCTWSGWSVAPGSTGLLHVAVRSNVPCRLTKDFAAGGTNTIHAVQISSKPANGTAVVNAYLITYRSRAGFYGKDSFVFLIKGSRMNVPYTSTVGVELDVRDNL